MIPRSEPDREQARLLDDPRRMARRLNSLILHDIFWAFARLRHWRKKGYPGYADLTGDAFTSVGYKMAGKGAADYLRKQYEGVSDELVGEIMQKVYRYASDYIAANNGAGSGGGRVEWDFDALDAEYLALVEQARQAAVAETA